MAVSHTQRSSMTVSSTSATTIAAPTTPEKKPVRGSTAIDKASASDSIENPSVSAEGDTQASSASVTTGTDPTLETVNQQQSNPATLFSATNALSNASNKQQLQRAGFLPQNWVELVNTLPDNWLQIVEKLPPGWPNLLQELPDGWIEAVKACEREAALACSNPPDVHSWTKVRNVR
jgi:hypothetical protein